MNSPPFIHLLFCYWVFGGVRDFLSVQRTAVNFILRITCIQVRKCILIRIYRLGWWLIKAGNIPFKEAMPTCFPKQSHQFILPPIITDSSEFIPSSMLASVRLLNLYQQDRWKVSLKKLWGNVIFLIISRKFISFHTNRKPWK